MKKHTNKSEAVSLGKLISIYALYTVSGIITFLGILFIIYCFSFDIKFKVLNAAVPGSIFGLAVSYLGIRYFFFIRKLKDEIFKNSSHFPRSNFKPHNFFKSAN